ncbi:MAG: hypothetical protein R2851_16885 [Caldilineaceae bacterium]
MNTYNTCFDRETVANAPRSELNGTGKRALHHATSTLLALACSRHHEFVAKNNLNLSQTE